jgi:hypothetical protein
MPTITKIVDVYELAEQENFKEVFQSKIYNILEDYKNNIPIIIQNDGITQDENRAGITNPCYWELKPDAPFLGLLLEFKHKEELLPCDCLRMVQNVINNHFSNFSLGFEEVGQPLTGGFALDYTNITMSEDYSYIDSIYMEIEFDQD